MTLCAVNKTQTKCNVPTSVNAQTNEQHNNEQTNYTQLDESGTKDEYNALQNTLHVN